MPRVDHDATLPGRGASPGPHDLSRAGRLMFRSLEQRMFGQSERPQLGRYHLIDTLGRGAMGVVHRAYDPDLDRRVAIKVVTLDGAEARARMVREAKALAKLNHPNVVTVHEVGDEGDDLFVVMECVDGGTLVDWLREHPASEEGRTQALTELMFQALEGLAAAHEIPLVHRDIKPANMLVGRDGRLRLADFGLARGVQLEHETTVRDSGTASAVLTQAGQLVGTPAFMAPEQFRGIADARSDQFSLAVSFFLAFYGRRPYPADSLVELIDTLESERFEIPSSSDVPDFVLRVLLRGMRAKPEDRFVTVREMAHALRSGARRRRRIIGGAALCTVAAAIAGAGWATAPTSCSEERERVEAAVSSHVERIHRRVMESGRPHPTEVLDAFELGLDRLVDDWSSLHLAACRDSRARDPEVVALGERRLACLDDGLAAVERALSEIDVITPARADLLPDTADLLAGLVDCREPDHETSGEHGRELVAMFRAGKMAEVELELDEARELYAAVLSATEGRSFPGLRAEVHTRLAAIAERESDTETFERHVMLALEEAERAGQPGMVALGWLQVAESLPLDGPAKTFELFMSLSHSARDRGIISDIEAANLGFREADLRLQRGQFDEALRLLREARGPAERSNNVMLPYLLIEEATILQRFGDLDGAVKLAERAVAVKSERFGEHHPDAALMQMHLAGIRSWRGEDEQTIEALDRVVSVFEERPDFETSSLLRALTQRGNAKRNIGRPNEALIDYDRAIALGETPTDGDVLILSAQVSKARALWSLERDEEALALLAGVLQTIDPGTVHEFDTRADSAILRASILAHAGRNDEALAQVDVALPWVEDAFGAESITRLQAAVEIADIWIALGEYERALAEIERFLPLAEHDLMFRAMLERSKAECLRDQGKLGEARAWAEKALRTIQASGAGERELVPIREVLASLTAGGRRAGDPDAAAPPP